MKKFKIQLSKPIKKPHQEDCWVDYFYVQPANSMDEAIATALKNNPGWTFTSCTEIEYFTEDYDHANQ